MSVSLATWVSGAILVSLGFLAVVCVVLVSGALKRGGRREEAHDPHDALASSRFTIPVSVIVTLHRPVRQLSSAITSLLALSYPELEVIVVADDSSGPQLATLRTDWQLEPKEFFYRRTLATGTVRRIFNSQRDPRLIVVDKEGDGRADALNCGLSFARYRYVVSVSPDVGLDSSALLRLMSPALRDPANVLAATSHVERRSHEADGGSRWERARDGWQRIGSLRSWLVTRLTSPGLQGGLAPQDVISAWRRDALLEMGGFSGAAADPELDMLLRLQTSVESRKTARIVRSSEIVGRLGPLTLVNAGAQARHRERAVIQALWALHAAPGTAVGRFTRICLFTAELFVPLLELGVLVAVIAGAAAGWFTPASALIVLVLLSFGNAAVTAAALLLRGAAADAPGMHELLRLLLLAPTEYIVYRPAIALARVASLVTSPLR